MSDKSQRPTPPPFEHSLALEDSRETPDIHYLHAPIMREQAEPRDGREPVPLWLTMFYGVVVFWAGYYLASYNGAFSPDIYNENSKRVGQAADAAQAKPDPALQGKRLFTVNCAACHQQSGKGVAGQFPPLAASEWVLGEPAVLIRILLHGLQGPISVLGETYNGNMPAFGAKLGDEQLSLVLTYIRQSWGNEAEEVTPEWIAQVRENEKERTAAWAAEELLALQPEPRPKPTAAEPSKVGEADVEKSGGNNATQVQEPKGG